MIGLKRGTVKLLDHQKEWEIEAKKTIARLKEVLGTVAKDIQHVGSTSVPSIKAKPIIDIAVAVDRFEDILALEPELKKEGFYYRPYANIPGEKLWACGSYYDGTGDLQTHFIHIVISGSMKWINYINFREYLIKTPAAAEAYEKLKLELAAAVPVDSGRKQYLKGKHDFIVHTLRKALADSYLGKTVDIIIDRPLGSVHPAHANIKYPINYGYLPNILGGDGEALDVYLLGVNEPVQKYTARIIGIVHRRNDIEDKLVAAPADISFHQAEIAEAVHFQEQYYETEIESIFEKSCGTVPYTLIDNKMYYLLVASSDHTSWGFPKGHMELGESEIETALRETWEEAAVKVKICSGFKRELSYPIGQGKTKTVVYFAAAYSHRTPYHHSEATHHNLRLLPFDKAYSLLTYENTKKLLQEVHDFYNC